MSYKSTNQTQTNNQTKSSAMSGSIYRANTVDISKFTFGEQSANNYGGKSCRIKYDGQDFYIQTPRMRLPYGISIYEEKDKAGNVIPNGKIKYGLDFSFAGYELDNNGSPADQKVREFYDFIENMDNLLMDQVIKNSKPWFGKDKCNADIAEILTRKTPKWSKIKGTQDINPKYPPSLKVKLGFWEDKFMCNCYDENKNPVTDLVNAIVPRTEAIAILKLTGVNFAQGACGYAFQVSQLKIFRPAQMKSYAFIDDEEDNTPVKSVLEDDEEQAPEVKKPVYDNKVEDSDNEEDELDKADQEEEEEEEAPKPVAKVEPPKPATKKVIVKKTK
jgi:hypothetical protein